MNSLEDDEADAVGCIVVKHQSKIVHLSFGGLNGKKA